MMPYTLKVRDEAVADIKRIVNYIAYSLLNVKAANDFLEALKKRFSLVAKEPHLYATINTKRKTYRKVPIKRYLALYEIDEKARTITIVAVVHNTSNYISRLKKSR